MRAKSNRHLAGGASRSACIAAALTLLSCGKEPGPAVSSSAVAASVSAAAPPSSASAPAPSAAAPSTAPPPITVAALRAEAAANPARFEGTKAALDGYFSTRSQRSFGGDGHPTHHFAVVHLAIVKGDSDTLACEMSEESWPPVGLGPGDPIAVSGVWSMDRMLQGGWAKGGGPLHIASCKIARRSRGDTGSP